MVEEREGHAHSEVYSVANLVTILRLIMVPFFFTVLLQGTGRSRVTAFIIYALAASTDWIDGQIARRTHTVTSVGKVLDPLVDRLLLASGVLGLYLIGELPLWVPVVLLLRDVYLLYGSYVLERHHIRLDVTRAGKLTTALLLAGFTSLMAGWPMVGGAGVLDSGWLPGLGRDPAALGIWFVYVGTALSLAAAVGYSARAWRALAQAKRASNEG